MYSQKVRTNKTKHFWHWN